ncbi:hypothetical protein HK101_004631 [Irineochytrium annulatum]|nr:hypothetical protein HK101_004631 [Irineochytrium annulatum]
MPAPDPPDDPDDPTLQGILSHLAKSQMTKMLRHGVDYTIKLGELVDPAVAPAPRAKATADGAVGEEKEKRASGPPVVQKAVWTCLICGGKKSVVIPLRGVLKQPQLSNIGTHLKTIKHRKALEAREKMPEVYTSVMA